MCERGKSCATISRANASTFGWSTSILKRAHVLQTGARINVADGATDGRGSRARSQRCAARTSSRAHSVSRSGAPGGGHRQSRAPAVRAAPPSSLSESSRPPFGSTTSAPPADVSHVASSTEPSASRSASMSAETKRCRASRLPLTGHSPRECSGPPYHEPSSANVTGACAVSSTQPSPAATAATGGEGAAAGARLHPAAQHRRAAAREREAAVARAQLERDAAARVERGALVVAKPEAQGEGA